MYVPSVCADCSAGLCVQDEVLRVGVCAVGGQMQRCSSAIDSIVKVKTVDDGFEPRGGKGKKPATNTHLGCESPPPRLHPQRVLYTGATLHERHS